MNLFVPIIIEREEDIKLGNEISNELVNFGIQSVLRFFSIDQDPSELEKCLNQKLMNNVNNKFKTYVYIVIANDSDALSVFIDKNMNIPVITCLSNKKNYSNFVTSMITSDPKNVAFHAAKICGVHNCIVVKNIIKKRESKNIKTKYQDLLHKYNLYNSKLLECCNIKKEDEKNYLDRLLHSGNTRSLYSFNSSSKEFIATDNEEISEKKTVSVPYKGEIVNGISKYWFEMTKHIISNHVLEDKRFYKNPKTMLVKNCTCYPVSIVLYSYLSGTSDFSLWGRYKNGERTFNGVTLGDNMKKNQKLDVTVFLFLLKDSNKKYTANDDYIINNIMSFEELEYIRNHSLMLFNFGKKMFEKNNLILKNAKYEFGKDKNDEIILIDDIHTPDSCTYWLKHSYDERYSKCIEPETIINYNYKNLTEELSDNDIVEISKKYMQLYELITGEEFVI